MKKQEIKIKFSNLNFLIINTHTVRHKLVTIYLILNDVWLNITNVLNDVVFFIKCKLNK